ncbi:5-guanidino-2-oxopentanoate decarboxylase [Marinobacterium maritimum]|uniref:5-guanidino-2-oxopentanoate decarboxylase n=1 Tax=Marinobacterium maritimum TaxID=500162 RepID=A0ABN1IA04_9GAMM
MTINNKKSKTCGQALVGLLEAYGVETVFGIPGVHTLDLYQGLAGSNIRHVLTRHEQGAGFMADGYARVTGKPGVCFTITGPGVTNIATPIGQAYADSIPMLVISSVNRTPSLGKGRGELHETQNQRNIIAPLTAFSATALCVNDIPALLARAFTVFASERPRPVFIELPLDVLATPVDENWEADAVRLARRPAPAAQDVAAAAQLLGTAKNPCIIAGGGAVESAAELQALAEKLAAPVFTTVAGKGLLASEHPLSAGATLCVEPTWEFISKADVVLAVGTELAETDMWREKLPLAGKLIRVDIDPCKMNDLYRADIAIVADARETLSALQLALGSHSAPWSKSDALPNLKTRIRNELADLQQTHQQILSVVANTLPSNAFVAADMTQIAYTGNYLFDVDMPRSWLHPTGYGTLGYALPAAVGAAIAAPERPALVLAGDGGILYTIQELATATEELNSPFVILLWNNDSLGQIRDDMIDRDIEPIGVSPRNPKFAQLAEAFGCRTYVPDSLQELQAALESSFAFNGPTLIELNESSVSKPQTA